MDSIKVVRSLPVSVPRSSVTVLLLFVASRLPAYFATNEQAIDIPKYLRTLFAACDLLHKMSLTSKQSWETRTYRMNTHPSGRSTYAALAQRTLPHIPLLYGNRK